MQKWVRFEAIVIMVISISQVCAMNHTTRNRPKQSVKKIYGAGSESGSEYISQREKEKIQKALAGSFAAYTAKVTTAGVGGNRQFNQNSPSVHRTSTYSTTQGDTSSSTDDGESANSGNDRPGGIHKILVISPSNKVSDLHNHTPGGHNRPDGLNVQTPSRVTNTPHCSCTIL